VGETATLEVLVNSEVLILDEVQGRHLVGTPPFVGTRWPAHATSTGKVLLAYLTEEERKEALYTPLPKLTPKTITSLTALRAELTACASEYAVAMDELEAGFVAVGAPVRNHQARHRRHQHRRAQHRLTAQRISDLAESVMQSAGGFRAGSAMLARERHYAHGDSVPFTDSRSLPGAKLATLGRYIVAGSYELSRARIRCDPERRRAHGCFTLFKYSICGPDAHDCSIAWSPQCHQCQVGQVVYTPWCDEYGKVIDDGTLARLDDKCSG
jgi:hypothetical protein